METSLINKILRSIPLPTILLSGFSIFGDRWKEGFFCWGFCFSQQSTAAEFNICY
jgi:hypothetical protein